jgi:hypothetical protein
LEDDRAALTASDAEGPADPTSAGDDASSQGTTPERPDDDEDDGRA